MSLQITSQQSIEPKKSTLEQKKQYESYVKFSLEENYFMLCLKKCITNFVDISKPEEKMCLAKCLDRAHDYLITNEESINPFNQAFGKKYVHKIDGLLVDEEQRYKIDDNFLK